MSNRELVIAALGDLPEDASFEEMVEHIRIIAAIREGQADLRAGRFITHEEMKRRIAERTADMIRRGEEAADAGRLVSHEEVKARVAKWFTR